MAIKAITQGLDYEVKKNANFGIIFSVIVTKLTEFLKTDQDFDDYCVFIKICPKEYGTEITFHDGGAKYDEKLDELVHVTYGTIKVKLPIDQEYTLYYSVYEQVLCFLDER